MAADSIEWAYGQVSKENQERRKRVERLEREIADLRAEVERLRKGAERYRWLRDNWFEFGCHPVNYPPGCYYHAVAMVADVETLDSAIDAAMEAANGR